ncbi:ATP-binding protein [Anaeroselena agilis]|uniref:histidine kinase n=1 Tax=Anaeroselena agilis TaxID=3063788 RepID=A0ABU3NU18_9FIRM|nr:ATP-binding protein [Selenomonadales bacterium 4137-cl]
MRNTLQLKLLAGFMLVITVTLGIVLCGISLFIKDQILSGKQQELLKKGTELAHTVQTFQDESGGLDRLGDYLANADQYLDARIWVLDDSRQIVAMSGRRMAGNHPYGPGFGPGSHGPMGGGMGLQPIGGMRSLINELDPVYNGQVVTKTMEQPYYGEKMVVVAVPIKQVDGTVSGAVLLNSPVTGINAFMQRIYYYVGGGGIAALLLALLVVNRLTRAIVKPLKAMQEAAGTMATGDYTARVAVTSGDEVGRLGHAFNALAQDLGCYMAEMEKTEKLRRDFVANVSHELRTPLTIMRSYTEALLDGTVDDPGQATKYLRIMRDETVRLEHLVKDLLDLSRLQSETVAWNVEFIPLPAIADSVIHMLKQAATQKSITLCLSGEDTVSNILGNGDRLTQLLLILLDNALKYTPAGGHIMISVTQGQGNVILAVTDSGSGIPAEDLPYIWDRFYKVDKSHSRTENGAGLGLAIAKQIIDRHKATASVDSNPGQGTTFTILFPVG